MGFMQKWKALPRAKKSLCILLILGFVLGALGVLFSATALREVNQLKGIIIRNENAFREKFDRLYADMRPDNTHKYVLRTYEGKIGIFNYDESVLYEILGVDVRTLPSTDRTRLDAGITVIGESALRAITEDYTG